MTPDPENPYTRMQREFYAREAAKWSPTDRNPVVGSWNEHEAWPDYDLLFEGIDTTGMIALDFGCGPGRMMCRYENWFFAIDGADIDPVNLRNAETLTGECQLYRVNGVELNGVPDSAYDLVYSTICLQHIPVHAIRLNLFREFFRVLEPGGWFTAQMGFGDTGDDRGVGYYEDRYDAPTTNGGCDVLVTDPAQLRDDLTACGFGNWSYRIRPVGPNDWHQNWIFFRARKSEKS